MTYPLLSKVKHQKYASLQQKKYRQKYNKFIVEGEKVVLELINSSIDCCDCIIIQEGYHKINYYQNVDIEIFTATDEQMKKLSSLSNPPPVLAIVKDITIKTLDQLEILPNASIFYLDGLKDPGNLGTIMRIGEWFGFQAIIFGPACVDPFNSKVSQSSMGSIFRIPLYEGHISQIASMFPDISIIGLDMRGEPLETSQIANSKVVVIGSESHGLSEESLPWITQKITISKISPTQYPESLNAATAAGIVAFHLANQKL